jgi:hypothetical protein
MEEPVPPLSDLAAGLTGLIVLPYLGPDAARTELSRPASPTPANGPSPQRQSARPAVPSAEGPSARPRRLTLRTIGVLRAIGERPGLSNTNVAEATGIGDPGQVSKLLSRLRRQGMIDCEQASDGRPVAKAWRLTAAGRRLLKDAGGAR